MILLEALPLTCYMTFEEVQKVVKDFAKVKMVHGLEEMICEEA